MESAFAWLGQFFEAFFKFIPHILIIRATHGGVYVAQSVMSRPTRFPRCFPSRCSVGRHIISFYRVRRNSMSPGFARHGFFGLPPLISHFTSALAFISRSTSAYTLVVSRDT